MPVLQLGFRLSRQALENCHPSLPRPPPLPDPFSLSWPLQFSYFSLAFGMHVHQVRGWSLQLLAYVALGAHFLTVCWKSSSSVLSTANSVQDPRLARKLANRAWRDLRWRLDCLMFPSVGIVFGLLCDLHSFSPVVQYSCLVAGLWITTRCLRASFWSVGMFMDMISNRPRHLGFVMVTNSRGRSRLCSRLPWYYSATKEFPVWTPIFGDLLQHTFSVVVMIYRGFAIMACWSLSLNLCGPCIASTITLRSWFLLLEWGVFSMRWLWVVGYLCSLPRRCFLFVKDILLDDPSLHLHAALDDLHQTASIAPDPFDSVLSSWVHLSGGDYSLSPVVDSSITQWDSVLLPSLVDISYQRIFGRHSWRLRRHFRHVAQCVTRQQDRLMSLTPTCPSPPAPSAEPDYVPSDLDKFLSSFHPAIAGIRMLTLERVDRLRFRHVSRCPSVSVSLRSCRESLASSAFDGFVFPAMMETVLHSVSGVDTCPLIVDSGASCCISPCRRLHFLLSQFCQDS